MDPKIDRNYNLSMSYVFIHVLLLGDGGETFHNDKDCVFLDFDFTVVLVSLEKLTILRCLNMY